MSTEIERKYMLPEYPEDRIRNGELTVVGRMSIDQTYLALAEKEEIRVRKLISESETYYTHTFKRGNGLAREEVEYEISEEIYNQLLRGAGLSPLIKTRTRVQDAAGRIYELDQFHQFELQTVETEFDSEEEAMAFVAPAWFGEELGSQQEYRNKQLWVKVQQKPFMGLGD